MKTSMIVTIEENVKMGMNDEYRTWDCGLCEDESAPFMEYTVRNFSSLAAAQSYGFALAKRNGAEFICDFSR